MLLDIRDISEEGRKGAFAVEDVESGAVVLTVESHKLPDQPLDFHRLIGPWPEGGRREQLLLPPGQELSCFPLSEQEQEMVTALQEHELLLPPVSFKLFTEIHLKLREEEMNKDRNADLDLKEGRLVVVARQDIKKGSRVKVEEQ